MPPFLRRTLRIVLLLLHFIAGSVLAVLVLRTKKVGPDEGRQKTVIAWWLLRLAWICGVRLTVEGAPRAGPVLFVANHVSWLDIAILGSLSRSSFLSKSEVRRWPVIGWLAWRAGTLFIERGGKGASERAMEQLVFRLRHGVGVILFPEGTTTNGMQVRKFHPRLFGAAQLTRNAVQPVAISYASESGGPPVAAFIDNQSLVANAWGVLGKKSTPCHVTFLPVINSSSLERRALSEAARASIAESLGLQTDVDIAL